MAKTEVQKVLKKLKAQPKAKKNKKQIYKLNEKLSGKK